MTNSLKIFSPILVLLLLAFTEGVFASSKPSDLSEVGVYSNVRLFQKYRRLNFLLEFSRNIETEDFKPQSIRVGGKYRLSRAIKLGLYALRVNNQRYDDDWVWKDRTWKWRDTSKRDETHFQLEGLYRNKIFKSSVFELRNVYEYNNFNKQQTLRLRPGITFFHLHPGWHQFNLYAQYEINVPLNYSEESIAQQWFYFGGLYHFTKRFSAGPFGGYRIWNWTTSSDAKERSASSYTSELSGLFLGLNFVLRNLF